MANKIDIPVPIGLSAEDRKRIGTEFVKYIKNRTKQGRGPDGQAFRSSSGGTSYSKNYREHQDFKNAGKSPSPINLTLTGDMLDSLKVTETAPGIVTIGYEDGRESDKSEWMREKGYDFLRLSDAEIDRVTSGFKPVSEAAAPEIAESIARDFLRRLIGS